MVHLLAESGGDVDARQKRVASKKPCNCIAFTFVVDNFLSLSCLVTLHMQTRP